MKGSLNIQVDYDTARTPSGDYRSDFVTKVKGDPILDQLSLAERQAFDTGIAQNVNEMLVGVHRTLIPKEEWLFEDVAKILFWFKRGSYRLYLQYPDWRERIVSLTSIEYIWRNIESTVSETMGDDFAKLLKFPDAKIKVIGERYLKKIVTAHFNKDMDLLYSGEETDTVDKLIVFMRKQMEIKPGTVYHGYNINIVVKLLKEIYAVTEDELIFLFECNGKRSLSRYFEGIRYVQESQIKFIAKRAEINPDVFLSQVIATAKVLDAKDHERDQQQ